jgi:coenzyme F420-reducing hydrogenase gamma subunit
VPPLAKEEKPVVAVYKLASYSGCQAQFANLNEELLTLLGLVDVGRFLLVEAATAEPPFDIGIVEGAVAGEHTEEHLRKAREECDLLVALGSCACTGGILRQRHVFNKGPEEESDSEEVDSILPRPLSDFVEVDAEVPGCPAELEDLARVLHAVLHGLRPDLPAHSVCQECLFDQNSCVLREDGYACLGPVTRGGCSARCPAMGQPCWGCRGLLPGTNEDALLRELQDRDEIDRRKFYESLQKGELA